MKVEFFHFVTLDSTQDYAKRTLDAYKSNTLSVIYATTQTCGRGQYDRRWDSACPNNIYASFVFFLPLQVNYLPNLAKLLAIAVCESLQDFPLMIKWPNDIFLHGKKMGGVLAETITEKDNIACIVGLGLNVNMGQEELRKIDQKATSILAQTGVHVDEKTLLQNIQKHFSDNLEKISLHGIDPFLTKLEERLLFRGEKIRFISGEKMYEGVLLGLTLQGALLVEINKTPEVFYSAKIILA